MFSYFAFVLTVKKFHTNNIFQDIPGKLKTNLHFAHEVTPPREFIATSFPPFNRCGATAIIEKKSRYRIGSKNNAKLAPQLFVVRKYSVKG